MKNNKSTTELDFAALQVSARGMSTEALEYCITDCTNMGLAAHDKVECGLTVEHTQGYFTSKACVYYSELIARGAVV